METLKHVYITLPSNVVSSDYGTNRIGHYHTIIPESLDFTSGLWECALVEFAFPRTWYNIKDNDIEMVITRKRGDSQKVETTHFSEGFYDSIPKLIEEMNRVIATLPRISSRMVFNEFTRCVGCKVANGEKIVLKRNLRQKLGFSEEQSFNRLSFPVNERYAIVKAPHMACLDPSLYNIYVYSNIVKNSVVGGVYAPLLRTITLDSTVGILSYQNMIFDSPHYVPLVQNYVKHIEIKIADDQGKVIAFKSGKVIVKLHVRQKPTAI